MEKIRAGKKAIGEGEPAFIIAEAGVNHNGKLGLAKALVDAAKEAGADAVKFQTFKSEHLVTKDASAASYQKKNIGKNSSQLEMLKKLELSYDSFKELKDYCDKKGIMFLSTPHTEDSAEFLDKLVPLFKIGSGDLTNLPFLEKIAKKKKPMILGTGMSTIDEVKKAVAAIKRQGNEEVIILHCTTNYPCPPEEVNLNAMKTIEQETGCIVGYSDHTSSVLTPAIAVAMGAKVVEKHFTTDKKLPGPDHKASLDPAELKEMVSNIRFTEKIMGSNEKSPSQAERKIKELVRKSLVAAVNIRSGEKIDPSMIMIKRPGTGIPPDEIKQVIGKTSKKDIMKDSLIRYEWLK